MDAKLFARPWRRALGVVSWGTVLVLANLGCEQGKAKASDGHQSQVGSAASSVDAPAVAAVEKKPAASLGQSEYKEDAFVLKLSAPKTVKVGAPIEVLILLEARSGYKVNDEYPIKFQFAEVAGVVPAKKIVRKDDARVEKKRATIPLKVTIAKSGPHRVAGKLSFSVCTDERCLIEKRELSVLVDAS